MAASDPTSSSKMINLQAVLLLSLAITFTVAWDPDCSRCKYQSGIGFVAGEYCQVYYMCIKSPNFKSLYPRHSDLYRWQVFCCAEGLAWDDEHLTCKRDSYCDDPRTKCPNATTTTNTPCTMKPHPTDETKYFTSSTYELMMCPYGTVWNQEYCTCIFTGPYQPPCRKILHYKFNGTYDSDSCYNFAVGEAYGKPYLTNNMLCLNGVDQFLSIPFLNNWFSWNPMGKSFTLCFWIKAKNDSPQTAGVFATNCYDGQDSLLDLMLDNGELVAVLRGARVPTGKRPNYDRWSKVCVVCTNGNYLVYYNAYVCGEHVAVPSPIISHADATVGYVNGKAPLNGYIDDLCFWTYALSYDEITACYKKGPSSVGDIEPQVSGG